MKREEGEMASGCGAELRTLIPWRTRSERCWKAAEVGRRGWGGTREEAGPAGPFGPYEQGKGVFHSRNYLGFN
jgi:hypothetical protein